MKKRFIGVFLVLALLLILVPVLVCANSSADLSRSAPSEVYQGQTVYVTIEVTINQDGVNSIGVTDTSPWPITYAYGGRFTKVSGNTVEAIWFGPYNKGQTLTLRYFTKAESTGSFTNGSVEYYVEGSGPFFTTVADHDVTIKTRTVRSHPRR